MPFPKQVEIEYPLLLALSQLGGEAKPRDVYPLVAEHFPELTEEEQEERLPNTPSTRKWTNLVQWVRQRLVDVGEIDGAQRGIWRITVAGREHLKREDSARVPTSANQRLSPSAGVQSAVSLRDLVNANHAEIRARLLGELKDLTPTGFEHFCREFLVHFGYSNVQVTKKSQDGGIDGHGDFKQGVISIRSAFQAKRWKDNPVGRPEIDQFRGAIQGDYDHGVFLTTSKFSKDAKLASNKKGAITILLLDGAAISKLLVDRGIGVRCSPLYLYDIVEDFFDFGDE